VHLPSPIAEVVKEPLIAASKRGIQIRLAYNEDHGKVLPPPPSTRPEILAELPFETRGILGVPDLMHHKYVVRDGSALWTGSTNWTLDSWTREENVVVTVESAELARRFTQDFEQLWTTRDVSKSGRVPTSAVRVDRIAVRPWFCPKRGEKLAHRIAHAIGSARRRIRVASPVITSAPILGTLAQVTADGHVDVSGVVDVTQIREVIGQWRENGNVGWKEPLLRCVLERGAFSGKRSTPYAPGTVHDYMHAKVAICDDVVFVGSFNLSHSGEQNAENVLEIADAGLAEQLASYVDELRKRYPPVQLPA
jgi:phosphatidylserine/phosphatidylglycerophosphate/cardiolipin synthase-like enzyme